MNEQPRDTGAEWISDLADGQLQGEALHQGLDALAADPTARATWHEYHLIGDVLRAPDLAGGTPPAAFLARLSQRLAAEPAPRMPAPAGAASGACTTPARRPAANDGGFGWRRVAAVASLALVAGAGWLAVDAWREPSHTLLAQDPADRIVRDARLDELLSAHRQVGSTSGLQAPAGFLQQAAFVRPGR